MSGGAERKDEGYREAARPVAWRHVIMRGGTGLCGSDAALERRAGTQHQRQIHLLIDLESDLRVDEIGSHLLPVLWVKGHATKRHFGEGTIALWQQQGNDLADEQATTWSALHPCVRKVEHSYLARSKFLGWLAKFVWPP